MSAAIDFFARLYAGQTGTLELRTVPLADTPEDRSLANRLRAFVSVTNGTFDSRSVEVFLAETAQRRMAAYYGVALRSTDAGLHRKGDGAHCRTLTALFVDADFKYLGDAETRKRLSTFALPPSLVVNSGGGLHPYWLLRDPIDLSTNMAQAKSILRRLAKAVADIVDESVSEPARVLRIPGSYNFKKEYGEPRPVVLEGAAL